MKNKVAFNLTKRQILCFGIAAGIGLKWLHEAMEYADATPSLAQAIKRKAFSQDKTLGPHVIDALLSEEKPNQREKFSFRADRLRRFIPESVPFNQTEDFVCKALEHYQQFLERQRKDRGDR